MPNGDKILLSLGTEIRGVDCAFRELGLCCATQKNVPSHIITRTNSRTKKNQKMVSAHIIDFY